MMEPSYSQLDLGDWNGSSPIAASPLSQLEQLLSQPQSFQPQQQDSAQMLKQKRLKSCAPCRIRRVKCDRTGNGTGDCLKCIEKSLQCTPMPQKTPKHAIRTGKRIDQARASFGTKVDPNRDPALVPIAALADIAGDETSHVPCQAQNEMLSSQALFSNSVTSRLAGTEIQGAVTASLLEFYLTTQPPIPLIADTAFHTSFELAGRRLHALDNQSQVLCSLIMALGARCTDNPLFVGTGAPKLIDLPNATRSGVDLREFGRRREAACEALTNQAIELADRMGTMRIATPESMASLMILESMVDQEDFSHTSSRPFVQAYNGHARTLLEEGNTIAGTAIGWTAYIRDAMKSAASGHAPSFSEEDIYLLRKKNNLPPVPLEIATSTDQSPDPELNFWMLLGSFMCRLAGFSRTVHLRLTGLKARSAPRIDEAFAHEFLAFLDVSHQALPILEARSRTFVPPTKERIQQDIVGIMRSLAIALFQLTFHLNRAVGTRISAKWDKSPGGSLSGWIRLVELRRETYNRAFNASRRITRILGDALNEGVALGTMEWLDNRASQMLFATLPAWLSLIVDTPSTEEGGPADFTFNAKLQDLRWAQNSLYSIGWSREKLSRPVLWVEEEIAKLEARRHSFWQPQQQQHPPQHSPPIPPHAPAPPTQSQFYPSEPQHPDFGSPSSSTSSPSSSFHPAHHQSMENSFAGFDFDPSSLVGGGNVGGGGAGDPFLSQPASAFGEEVGMSLNGMTGTGQLYTDEEISLILGAVTADLEAFDEGGVFDGLLG